MRRVGAVIVAIAGAVALAAQQPAPQSADLRFRIAVLQSTARPPEPGEIARVLARADALLAERTGAHLIQVLFADVGPGNATTKVRRFIAGHQEDLPDGILLLSDDEESTEYGGYSFDVPRQGPSLNRFPSPVVGAGRVYVAVVDMLHKYAKCGYDDSGKRVSPYSRGGECLGKRGLTCVENGRQWSCPGTTGDLNAEPDYFMGCIIVHEFLHPFGALGDDDHFRGPTCAARLGLTSGESRNERRAQEACGICPDLFPLFKAAP